MPRPLKANAYPIVFWRVAEQFHDGSAPRQVTIRGEDIYNPGRGETPEGRAAKTRFQWYGFKRAMEKIGHPFSRTIETLELSIIGSVLTIQRRDDTEVNRALERVLEAQGIRVSSPPGMLKPPLQYAGIVGVEGEPQQTPYDYGLGAKMERTEEEKRQLEQQWLKEGVAQTKHFEQTLRDLGFGEAEEEKLKEESSKSEDSEE